MNREEEIPDQKEHISGKEMTALHRPVIQELLKVQLAQQQNQLLLIQDRQTGCQQPRIH